MESLLSQLADRLTLCPSTHRIDTEDRQRILIPFNGGNLEAWTTEVYQDVPSPNLITLKFPGTSGRAERAGPHPCELWPDIASHVWAINPAGYGGSDGVASLRTVAAQCDAIIDFVRRQFPEHIVLLAGNSLGCLYALYLTARYDIAGVFLRNPPPLRELIAGRLKYNWWNFGLARFVAAEVPDELNSIDNAAKCDCPAFFLRSEKDRVVPTVHQRQIIDAYSGDVQEFVIPGADHHEFVTEKDFDQYRTAMTQFKAKLMKHHQFHVAQATPIPARQ